MLSALSQLDHEEPCVALLDEVEKVFSRGSGDHSGVTSSLLSQLLWWLAERRSRVLVVLTTNDRQKLPRELYRAGRIDEVMWFGGLQATAALQFARRVLETFPTAKKLVGEAALQGAVQQLVQATAKPASEAAGDAGTVSQAAVTKLVYCLVKEVSGK
jgi:SpoVK/Ycf46/Vps4 family AAA+-type ATPase